MSLLITLAGIVVVPFVIIRSIVLESIEAPFFSTETIVIDQDITLIDKAYYSIQKKDDIFSCWIFKNDTNKLDKKYYIKKNEKLNILDVDYKSIGISISFDEEITLEYNDSELMITLMANGFDLSTSQKINILNNCESINYK